MFMTDKDGYPVSCFNSPEEGRPPKIKHPEVDVQLVGNDGNAFAVIGAVVKGLRRAGVDQTEVTQFMEECNQGNYDNLLQTCMRWVNVS